MVKACSGEARCSKVVLLIGKLLCRQSYAGMWKMWCTDQMGKKFLVNGSKARFCKNVRSTDILKDARD